MSLKLRYILVLLSCFLLWSASNPSFAQGKRALREMAVRDKSPEVLKSLLEVDGLNSIPVIIQVKEELFEQDRQERQLRGQDRVHMLDSIAGYRARLNPSQIRALLRSDVVEYVTLDPVIRGTKRGGRKKRASLSEYRKIIGSDLVKTKGDKSRVAVFDSGVSEHEDLKKPKVKVDFTSGSAQFTKDSENDGYGHGTHVAGIISGSGKESEGKNRGVSEAEIIDLKVIGGEGWGVASNLIKAIDWVIANKNKYDIRVANLSLGHPPLQSYRKDPLCAAVRRMVKAGIVTVVSAGNLGRTDDHPVVYGGITVPGIEPSVITVGAINNQGTLTHKDDIGTSYSSRGPTIDGLFKPDLVAPGNGIPGAIGEDSFLEEHYPDLKVDEGYLDLSGSSMATAFVSGVVTQMLDENERLTPGLVKMILLLTATKLEQPHLFQQGNGMVNAVAAAQMAKLVDVKKRRLKKDIDPYWDLVLVEGVKCKKEPENCERVWVGGAVAYADQVVFSPLVNDSVSSLWGSSFLWSDSLSWEEKSELSWAKGFFDSGSVLWSDSFLWADSLLWADTKLNDSSVLWSDSFLWAESFLWSDSVLWSENLLPHLSASTADHTHRGDP